MSATKFRKIRLIWHVMYLQDTYKIIASFFLKNDTCVYENIRQRTGSADLRYQHAWCNNTWILKLPYCIYTQGHVI
jgi:hypothetical protein